jgi:hypothetical protein
VRQTGLQKSLSNLLILHIEVKKNRQPTVNPFGYAQCLKVTRSLAPARPLGVGQEEFCCNSLYWVSLPEILVMASLLRTVPGRAEADTNDAGLLG